MATVLLRGSMRIALALCGEVETSEPDVAMSHMSAYYSFGPSARR